MEKKVKPIPDGFHSVTPYLVVPGAARLIDFLKRAFGAQETFRMADPDGNVRHAEMRIGDSPVMLSEASEQFPAMPGMIYLYVNDADATYAQAVKAGGKSIREPKTEFYGDRSGGIQDPSGNRWWIATHVEDIAVEELERRAAAAQTQSHGA